MPSGRKRWMPGEQILQQDMWWGQFLSSRPVTVVEDRQELLALYTHPRAPWRTASAMPRDRYALPVEQRATIMMGGVQAFEERLSGNSHVLTLTSPDSGHSVWLFWTVDWDLRFWYVNLQAPIKRTARGILVQDHVLDVLVQPDMSWSWKDDDEFSELHRRGFFTDEQALSVRVEGERMVRKIESNASPFCDGWERWRANPRWPVPYVPADWDVLGEGKP